MEPQCVRYEQREGNIIKMLQGLQKREGYLYRYKSINCFHNEVTKIPDDYIKITNNEEWIAKYIYNPDLKELIPENDFYKEHPKNCDYYFTHDNGGILVDGNDLLHADWGL